MLNQTTNPIPGYTVRELRTFDHATKQYLAALRDAVRFMEPVEGRLDHPGFASLVRDIRSALRADVVGTPASICGQVAELLGEGSPGPTRPPDGL